ncbi:MAG: class I SAM-dependent methyltransferase [Vicinamibacteria bacterium]|nr:class I SAM-dependent methyltransferase [Vicinamibacteria bacterium]
MRSVDRSTLERAAESRFRSAYDYAVFEYLRGAKIHGTLERAGVRIGGRLLDCGCGGGGVTVSFAGETQWALGLDPAGGFQEAGIRLAREKKTENVRFVRGDGVRLPFPDALFNVVLSHSVIEHVSSATGYLSECRRVLRPGGALYLSTAPCLSLAGAHLPRLIAPVPLHILLGRRAAFRIFCFLGRHAAWLLREGKEANTFICLSERNVKKRDDLLQRVTVARLDRWIEETGFRRLSSELHVTGFFRRALPGPLRRRLMRRPWIQDVMIGQIQYVLERP